MKLKSPKLTKEEKILIKRNDILEKSKKFFNKYYNFNKFCLLKNDKPLYNLIIKEYQSIDEFINVNNNLFIDTGRRSWSYNNICLGYNSKIIPDKTLKIINKDNSLIKNVSDENIYKNNYNKRTFIGNDLIKFLEKFLKTKLDQKEFNDVTYYYSKNYDRYFFIIDDIYKHSSFHKSINRYNNYVKDLNRLIKKNKNRVVFDYDNFINIETVKKQLMLGGINIYSNFKFLCIDPPTKTNLGYAIFEYNDGKYNINEVGVKELNKSYYRGRTLKGIYEFINSTIDNNNIDLIVSESSFGYGVAEIRTMLSENVGIFNLICEYNNIPFITVSPLQFKANVLGDRKATKEITINWVKKNLDLKKDISEHEADSVVIGISFLMDRDLINDL